MAQCCLLSLAFRLEILLEMWPHGSMKTLPTEERTWWETITKVWSPDLSSWGQLGRSPSRHTESLGELCLMKMLIQHQTQTSLSMTVCLRQGHLTWMLTLMRRRRSQGRDQFPHVLPSYSHSWGRGKQLLNVEYVTEGFSLPGRPTSSAVFAPPSTITSTLVHLNVLWRSGIAQAVRDHPHQDPGLSNWSVHQILRSRSNHCLHRMVSDDDHGGHPS